MTEVSFVPGDTGHITAREVDGIYDIPIRSITGEDNLLGQFQGTVVLFIPVGWENAHAKFRDLQVIHDEFEHRGFTVVAILTGQRWDESGRQIPPISKSNEEIAALLESEYPYVTFPFTEKILVNPIWSTPDTGDEYHPEHELASYLKGGSRCGRQSMVMPALYETFVFDRDGTLAARFNYTQELLAEGSEGEQSVREAVDSILEQPRQPRHAGHHWHYPDVGSTPVIDMPTGRPMDWVGLGINHDRRFTRESPPPTEILIQHAIDVVYASLDHLDNEERLGLVQTVIHRLRELIDADEHEQGR
jgi:glutathione peroxidase-family protein